MAHRGVAERHGLPRFASMLPTLSAVLHDVLHTIERNSSQSVLADLDRGIFRGLLAFVLTTQHTPDLSTICDACFQVQHHTVARKLHVLKPMHPTAAKTHPNHRRHCG
jgi:hypothetical protein